MDQSNLKILLNCTFLKTRQEINKNGYVKSSIKQYNTKIKHGQNMVEDLLPKEHFQYFTKTLVPVHKFYLDNFSKINLQFCFRKCKRSLNFLSETSCKNGHILVFKILNMVWNLQDANINRNSDQKFASKSNIIWWQHIQNLVSTLNSYVHQLNGPVNDVRNLIFHER